MTESNRAGKKQQDNKSNDKPSMKEGSKTKQDRTKSRRGRRLFVRSCVFDFEPYFLENVLRSPLNSSSTVIRSRLDNVHSSSRHHHDTTATGARRRGFNAVRSALLGSE